MWYTLNMNMNLEKQISEEVFLRIRTIYRIKKIAFSQYTNSVLLCVLLVYSFFVVSVMDVLINTVSSHSVLGGINYFFTSLIHSQLLVQFLSAMIFLASIRMVVNLFRKLSSTSLVSKLIPRRIV